MENALPLSRRRFLTCSATLGATVALSSLLGCSSDSAVTNANSANSGAGSAITSITTGELRIIEDDVYGAIQLDISKEEFAQLGFLCGDSVDIAFSNGQIYTDVPFFDGYYTLRGDLVLVSYPSFLTPRFTRDQMGIWDESGVSADDTATVTLREAGKYLIFQQALGVTYSYNRSDFTSDAAFANFRTCTGGKMRSGLVYRSSSPIDNAINRASYANALVAAAGVQYGLDLADNEEMFAGFAAEDDGSCRYYIDLHDAGNVDTIKLSADFGGDAFKKSLAAALERMFSHPGPYLVHCLEGKDRTGFVCMILEALAGASLDEIIDDYMITYDNYYYISKDLTPERYEVVRDVKCYDSLMTLAGVSSSSEVTAESLHAGAENYLLDGGLTAEEIAHITSKLTQ